MIRISKTRVTRRELREIPNLRSKKIAPEAACSIGFCRWQQAPADQVQLKRRHAALGAEQHDGIAAFEHELICRARQPGAAATNLRDLDVTATEGGGDLAPCGPRHWRYCPDAPCGAGGRRPVFIAIAGAAIKALKQAVAFFPDCADAAQHFDSGVPSSSSECEASIRLPSSTSGTTSVAPAASSRSIGSSSVVRTTMGRSVRIARVVPTISARLRDRQTTPPAPSPARRQRRSRPRAAGRRRIPRHGFVRRYRRRHQWPRARAPGHGRARRS